MGVRLAGRPSRMFGGRKYYRWFTYVSKVEAKKKANKMRRDGSFVRITKDPFKSVYRVYIWTIWYSPVV